ncbi:hypothetical protein [Piscinibacter sp.]|uniref:hypothetical protein n=1 Tax=Piscinibacter sp. TaxID=1903157 RepID=UPI0039E26235
MDDASKKSELPVLAQAREILAEYGQPMTKFSTLAGLLITCVYFIKSGAMPLDSLSSLGALALVVAVVALFTALMFLVLWVTPPAITLLFQREDPSGCLLRWFQYRSDGKVLTLVQQRGRLLLFAGVTCAAVWVWLIAWSLPDIFAGEAVRWGSRLATALAVLILCWHYMRPSIPEADNRTGRSRSWLQFFFVLAYGAVSLYQLWLFILLLTTSDFRHDDRAPVMWGLLTGGLLVVIAVNSIGLGVCQHFKGSRAIGMLAAVGLCSLLLLLTLLGSSARLLDGLMSLSTVRVGNTTLALDGKACAAVRMLRVAAKPAGDNCLLENVTLISRVGERWVVACDRSDTVVEEPMRRRRRNFQLDAKSVQAQIDASAEVRERTGKSPLCS